MEIKPEVLQNALNLAAIGALVASQQVNLQDELHYQ